MSFDQGHALIIGVGKYQYEPPDVPIVAEDAQEIGRILKDENLCGYPPERVETLTDGQATRAGILEALERLSQRASEDDTVFLFYAGHGDLGDDGNYYLVSHDARLKGGRVAAGSGVSEADLLDGLRKVKAGRALFVFNACFSGNIPPTLSSGKHAHPGKALSQDTADALLGTGSGRIILAACREDQYSYVGDGKLTIFTQALAGGLRGRGVGNQAGYVSAFSLYEQVYQEVTEQTAGYGVQQPELSVIRLVGKPFPVGLYKGASLLGQFDEGQPLPATPAVRQVPAEKAQRIFNQVIQVRDGAVATGKGAVAVGKGGIYIGGNVGGDVIGAGGKKDG